MSDMRARPYHVTAPPLEHAAAQLPRAATTASRAVFRYAARVTDWVLAAERAYVAAAIRGATAAAPPAVQPAAPWTEPTARAIAAAGAIASRYLAVGTPRSFGILIDDEADVAAAAWSLAAHRAWFAPRDIRCAATRDAAAALAAATGGRVVSVDEALACDIANVYSRELRVTPARLRRGTHVNALWFETLDPELPALATVTRETALPALAAGLVDGRQLDEITIFVVDGAPIAAAALR